MNWPCSEALIENWSLRICYWRLKLADGGEDAVQQGMGIGRAAGDVHVHGKDGVHAAAGGVVLAEDAAAATARAHGHDQPRAGHGFVSFPQRQFHVARDRAGHQQHVGMARRGDEVNAETLDVIDRAVQAVDFDFAAVARTGVHLADVQGTAEHFRGARLEFAGRGLRGIRAGAGEGPRTGACRRGRRRSCRSCVPSLLRR